MYELAEKKMLDFLFWNCLFLCVFQSINSQSSTGCNGMGSKSTLYDDIKYGRVCFWVSTTENNRTGAQTSCVNQGGSLALIVDSAMEAAIDTFLDSVGRQVSYVYIGYDVDTTSNYQLTTLSGQTQQYENFYVKNPNNPNWHCVYLYLSSWFAGICDKYNYYLCSTIPNRVKSSTTTTTTTQSQSTTFTLTTTASFSTQSTATTTKIASSALTSTPIDTTSIPSTSTTTHSTFTNSPQNCSCPYGCIIRYTSTINSTEELDAIIAELKRKMRVKKSTLSSAIRKRISADDPRPSAQTFGYVGVLLIAFVFGGIVALDSPLLLFELRRIRADVVNLKK